MENDKPKPAVQPLVFTSGQNRYFRFRSFPPTFTYTVYSVLYSVEVQFFSYEISFYRNGSLILIVFQV